MTSALTAGTGPQRVLSLIGAARGCFTTNDQGCSRPKAGSASGERGCKNANQDAAAAQLLRRAGHIKEAGTGWDLAAAARTGIVTLTRKAPDGARKVIHRIKMMTGHSHSTHGSTIAAPF